MSTDIVKQLLIEKIKESSNLEKQTFGVCSTMGLHYKGIPLEFIRIGATSQYEAVYKFGVYLDTNFPKVKYLDKLLHSVIKMKAEKKYKDTTMSDVLCKAIKDEFNPENEAAFYFCRILEPLQIIL